MYRLSEWEKSAIVKHAQQHEHRIMWDDTQLITSINNWNTRSVREAIEIHRHDTVPQDPGLHINNILDTSTTADTSYTCYFTRVRNNPRGALHIRVITSASAQRRIIQSHRAV